MYTAVVSELLRAGGGVGSPLYFFWGEAMGKDLERYHRRKEAGLCPRCGGIPAPGRSLCAACLSRAQAHYRYTREVERCVQCGAPVDAGTCRCKACSDFRSLKRSGTELERWERREAYYLRKEDMVRFQPRGEHGRFMRLNDVQRQQME